MRPFHPTLIIMCSLSLIDARSFRPVRHLRQRQDLNVQGGGQGGLAATCLQPNALQDASTRTGQEPGTANIKPGQAPAATNNANFINFCVGQTLTNGKQVNGGSCNGIPMGKIPAVTNMVSAIITNPNHNSQVLSGTTFDIEVQTINFQAGTFTNPDVTYYSAPQDLNNNGNIIGHCHVSVQRLGDQGASFDIATPPDPTDFAFFKGIDDAGNGQGLLKATITDGLPAGIYRVCTLISSSNHQPVIMPVAQRGPQDDCTKFEIVQSNQEQQNDQEDQDEIDNGNTPDLPPNTESPNPGNGGKGNNGENGGQGGAPPSTTPPPPFSNSTLAPTPTAPEMSLIATITQAAPNMQTGVGGSSEVIKIKSGILGGEAPFVLASGNEDRPFKVNGKLFANAAEAVGRSCRIQFRSCVGDLRSGKLQDKTIDDCRDQRRECGPDGNFDDLLRRMLKRSSIRRRV